jgi:RimJ/RimL family protein N-acetyltransferase
LIDAVVGWASAIGAQRVSLAVKSANSRAIALYQRAGFVDQGVSADAPDERMMIRLITTT